VLALREPACLLALVSPLNGTSVWRIARWLIRHLALYSARLCHCESSHILLLALSLAKKLFVHYGWMNRFG